MDKALVNSIWAAIDIGSHTIRLLIAEFRPPNIILPVLLQRHITRLSFDFSSKNMLADETMSHSLAVLKQFADILTNYGVKKVRCGATGVLRRASNASCFLKMVQDETGFQPRILTEDEEALIAARGVLSALPKVGPFVICFDLGGSSTELLLMDTDRSEALWSTSIFWGAATLTESYLTGDPPDAAAVAAAGKKIEKDFAGAVDHLKSLVKDRRISCQATSLVGTAGTVTTLAAMVLQMRVYTPAVINGFILSHEDVDRIIYQLGALSLSERRRIIGLEPGREGIILGGAIIVRKLMQMLGYGELMCIDSGLLEGLLLSLIEEERGELSGGLIQPLTWRYPKA